MTSYTAIHGVPLQYIAIYDGDKSVIWVGLNIFFHNMYMNNTKTCKNTRIRTEVYKAYLVLPLNWFGLLSGHLYRNLLPARLAIQSHCLLSIFNCLFISLFESRSGLMSFQTDHSIWCVIVAFLTKPKPHFKVLPGHLR